MNLNNGDKPVRDFFHRNVLDTMVMTLALCVCGLLYQPCEAQVSTASAANTTPVASPVTAALTPFVESGEMPGFVTMVATKDQVIDTTVLGYADIEKKQPMREDTLFWIASMTKTFTGVAVLMLVDEGKIGLDDPISKYLPEFEQVKVAVPQENGDILLKKPRQIPTVRQVLSHTSGWAFLTPYMTRFGIDAMPLARKMQDIADIPLESEPGTKFNYSNVGIDIAAAIVEKVSGQKFEDFCKQRIFEPLGMTHTTFFPTAEMLENYAQSYSWNADQKQLRQTPIGFLNYPIDSTTTRFSDGGGLLFSTAGDILKFYQMLLGRGEFQGKRLVSGSAIDLISHRQTGDASPDTPYGFGTFLGDGGSFGHGGAHATDARVFPQRNVVTIYMVQVTGVPKQGEAKAAFDQAAATLVP